MRKQVEFATGSQAATGSKTTTPTAGTGYKSLVFTQDYWQRQLKFERDITWLRFLPAVAGSSYPWMTRLEVYKKGGVTFVSPNTFDTGARNPFQIASTWLKKNRPALLGKKDVNPDGLKPWPSTFGIAWAIDTQEEAGKRLRLFYGSLYDGVRGGTKGIGDNIWQASIERDQEPGSPTVGELVHGEITDPTSGRLVKITRTKTPEAEYPSYGIGIGKSPAPLDPLMAELTDEEVDSIKPLEKVVYIPSEEEIHGFLRGYIGNELHAEIFPTAKVDSAPDETEG